MIAGIDTKEQLSKSDIIQAALKEMGQTNASAVLIGDSQYDAEGAEKAGVSFIGVTYGFGFFRCKGYFSLRFCRFSFPAISIIIKAAPVCLSAGRIY
mgnify:CR=1 FL=1